MSGDASPSRRRLWLFRAVSALIGVAIGTVAVEVFLEIFDIGPELNVVYRENYRLSSNPVLWYELVPGSPDGDLVINSAGMRDREFAIPKPDGVFRIAAIGDSVTVRINLDRSETWPKLLESFLNEYAPSGAPEFEVLNMGVVGYNAPQVVESLPAKGLAFEPDLVIYAYCLNDPLASHSIGEKLEAMTGEAERRLRDVLFRGIGRHLAHLRLYALIVQPRIVTPTDAEVDWRQPLYRARLRGREVQYLEKLYADPDAWERTAKAMARLSELTRSRSLPTFVAVFPIGRDAGFRDYPLGPIHGRVAAEAQARGLAALDLAATFAQAERRFPDLDLFWDLVHPSAEGYRFVAMKMIQSLCASGELAEACDVFEGLRAGGGRDADFAALVAEGR